MEVGRLSRHRPKANTAADRLAYKIDELYSALTKTEKDRLSQWLAVRRRVVSFARRWKTLSDLAASDRQDGVYEYSTNPREDIGELVKDIRALRDIGRNINDNN